MISTAAVQYVSDMDGKQGGVIVPIELWSEIISEPETARLLASLNVKVLLQGSSPPPDGVRPTSL